jgi:hypothetical protein
MPNPSPVNSPRHEGLSPDGSRHRPSARRRTASSTAPVRPPDLAEAARCAVVSFLHDAAAETAERESSQAATAVGGLARPAAAGRGAETGVLAADIPIQWSARPPARPGLPESTAVRAAAASVATLERIEKAAAKVEADIAAALQAHARLQAGAGEAAEAAVRAAEEAWRSASSAAESDRQAKISLRHVVRWVAVVIVLVAIMAGLLIASASTTR